jgi:hypothetical protein
MPVPPAPVKAWRTVRDELEAYGGGLVDKPEMLALSKADLVSPRPALAPRSARSKRPAARRCYVLSAATRQGVDERARCADRCSPGAMLKGDDQVRVAGHGRRSNRQDATLHARGNCARLVVKIGSSLLVDAGQRCGVTGWPPSSTISPRAAPRATGDRHRLVGRHRAGRPAPEACDKGGRASLEDAQAAAATGQVALSAVWEAEMLSATSGITMAQMLLTLGDLEDRRRYPQCRGHARPAAGAGRRAGAQRK